MAVSLLILPLAAPVMAAQVMAAQPASTSVATTVRSAAPPVQLAAFGDGPPTGAHRGKRSRSGDVPKAVEPSHEDMHGATREGADQIYRKKYGF